MRLDLADAALDRLVRAVTLDDRRLSFVKKRRRCLPCMQMATQLSSTCCALSGTQCSSMLGAFATSFMHLGASIRVATPAEPLELDLARRTEYRCVRRALDELAQQRRDEDLGTHCWMASAQSRPLRADWNATMKPSPVVFTSKPSYAPSCSRTAVIAITLDGGREMMRLTHRR